MIVSRFRTFASNSANTVLKKSSRDFVSEKRCFGLSPLTPGLTCSQPSPLTYREPSFAHTSFHESWPTSVPALTYSKFLSSMRKLYANRLCCSFYPSMSHQPQVARTDGHLRKSFDFFRCLARHLQRQKDLLHLQ